MVMQYFNQMKDRRRSQAVQQPKPVLTEDDEAFLRKVISQPDQNGEAPENKEHAQDSGVPQQSPTVESKDIPLPASPAEEFGKQLGEQGRRASQLQSPEQSPEPVKPQPTAAPEKKKKRWSTMLWGRTDSKKVRTTLL